MSTYSSNLRIELITTGTQAGTWGTTTNDNLSTVLEAAIAGSVSVTTVAANEALTYLNGPTSTSSLNTSVRAILTLNTSTGANFAVYAPPVSKLYIIKNSSSYTATIYNSTVIGNTTGAGTGVAIPAGKVMAVWSDATNFAQQITYLTSPELAGTPTAPTASPGTNTTQIATTAFVQTAAGLRELLSNKSTDTTLGTSNTLYPSQKAVKKYVDNQIATVTAGGVTGATTSSKGIIKLAGDLGGTSDLPTVPGLASKQNTLTDVNFGSFSNGLTAKTTPVDADTINIVDSVG